MPFYTVLAKGETRTRLMTNRVVVSIIPSFRKNWGPLYFQAVLEAGPLIRPLLDTQCLLSQPQRDSCHHHGTEMASVKVANALRADTHPVTSLSPSFSTSDTVRRWTTPSFWKSLLPLR